MLFLEATSPAALQHAVCLSTSCGSNPVDHIARPRLPAGSQARIQVRDGALRHKRAASSIADSHVLCNLRKLGRSRARGSVNSAHGVARAIDGQRSFGVERAQNRLAVSKRHRVEQGDKVVCAKGRLAACRGDESTGDEAVGEVDAFVFVFLFWFLLIWRNL